MYENLMIGSHVSSSGDLLKTLGQVSRDHGVRVVQILVGNPHGALTANVEKKYMELGRDVKALLKENAMKLFIHSPYVLNFAKDPLEADAWWIRSMITQLKIADALGAEGCVLHMGKAVKLGVIEAKGFFIANVKETLRRARADGIQAKIFIETAAGQGTELYATLDGTLDALVEFINHFDQKDRRNLSLCVDTCHIFAAGYNIHTAESTEVFWREWEEKLGIEMLGVIHMNNSMKSLGCRVDRHAPLKQGGAIGLEGLSMFAKIGAMHEIPMIIETGYGIYDMPNLAEFILDRSMIDRPFDEWLRMKQRESLFETINM